MIARITQIEQEALDRNEILKLKQRLIQAEQRGDNWRNATIMGVILGFTFGAFLASMMA